MLLNKKNFIIISSLIFILIFSFHKILWNNNDSIMGQYIFDPKLWEFVFIDSKNWNSNSNNWEWSWTNDSQIENAIEWDNYSVELDENWNYYIVYWWKKDTTNNTNKIIKEKIPKKEELVNNDEDSKIIKVTQWLFDYWKTQYYKFHKWIDFWIKYEWIYAPINGTILFAWNLQWYGNTIVIENFEEKELLLFSHLSDINITKSWTKVNIWDYLGITWNTWNSIWAHLHIEYYKNWIIQDENVVLKKFKNIRDKDLVKEKIDIEFDFWLSIWTFLKKHWIEKIIDNENIWKILEKLERISLENNIPQINLLSLYTVSNLTLDNIDKEVKDNGFNWHSIISNFDWIDVNKYMNVNNYIYCLYSVNLWKINSCDNYKKWLELLKNKLDIKKEEVVVKEETNESISLSSTSLNFKSLIDSKVKDWATIIGCRVWDTVKQTNSSCNWNPIYIPPKYIWEIYKKYYDYSKKEDIQNTLIAWSHQSLESHFDKNAKSYTNVPCKWNSDNKDTINNLYKRWLINEDQKNKFIVDNEKWLCYAIWLFQMIPSWWNLESRLNPEWQVKIMKEKIDERLVKYKGNLTYAFQTHYWWVDSNKDWDYDLWYWNKYKKVYDFYTNNLIK